MTWSNRFRLLGGILAVLVLVAGLTLLFNHRQARVASFEATVSAPTAQVGSGYGGVLTEQFVRAGDTVAVGDPLFTVISPEVNRERQQGVEPQSTAAYQVDTTTGAITYLAVIDGQVTQVSGVLGSYLTPGASLATISATDPKSVLARFDLEAVDYGRVERGAPVTINLANNAQVQGSVADVTVTTKDGRAITQVRVESEGLTDPRHEALTRSGSPVQAVMSLRDDGILAGPTDALLQFLVKVGLR